jgi:polyferredoxin
MLILFPILMNYFSVFLIIEGSSKGIMVFSFFFWTAWVVLALFFGRAACGYLCPLGAYQETKDRMAPKSLIKIRYLKWVKYVLAVAWVGAIIYFAIVAGGYKTINLLYNTESGVSVSSAQSWLTWGTIVLVVLLPAFLTGRRGFCHYFCPWGVLNIDSTRIKSFFRWPSLHLEASR